MKKDDMLAGAGQSNLSVPGDTVEIERPLTNYSQIKNPTVSGGVFSNVVHCSHTG